MKWTKFTLNVIVFDSTPSITLDIGLDRERTHFAFGAADALYVEAKVLGIRPRGLERVEIIEGRQGGRA